VRDHTDYFNNISLFSDLILTFKLDLDPACLLTRCRII